MKNSENPVFSIITVVYNSAALLEGTVQSVIQQSYQHIEYIIVDGNSNDGTLDVIRKYEDHIDQWISEPDQGIYDAMNKGIQMATGDFIWFMNAGDHLFDKDTLKQMAQKCEPETTILYGEVMLVNDDREHMGHRSEVTTQQLPEALDWKSLKMGMVVSHQAFVPARRIAPPYIDGNLSADIDWVIKCLKKSTKNTHCHLVLAEYLMGGISVQKHKESLKDRYQVLRNHYGLVSNFINHVFIVFRAAGKRIKRRNKVRY